VIQALQALPAILPSLRLLPAASVEVAERTAERPSAIAEWS